MVPAAIRDTIPTSKDEADRIAVADQEEKNGTPVPEDQPAVETSVEVPAQTADPTPEEAPVDETDETAEAEEPVEDEPSEPALEAPAEEPKAETAEESGAETSKRRWYVIHTYSGHENKVKANLERAIQYAKVQDKFGEIVVATEDYAVMKAGKKHITKRKTFPSYVLIEMEMSDDIRALVQNIPGVTHFVGDKKPAPLSEAEVRRIRGEEVREVGKVTADVPFKVGETVKVTEGPFADFVGSVDEINPERGKLRVMVSIFGRPTAVELDIMHVTSI